MINTIQGILDAAKGGTPGVIAVAAAHDEPVIEAVVAARKENIATPILVGHVDEISQMLKKLGEDPAGYEMVAGDSDTDCAAKAVALCAEGKANFLMKGILGTADLMRAVFNKEHGLRTGHLTTHCMFYEIPAYGKMVILTDGGVNTFPDLDKKAEILENAAAMLAPGGVLVYSTCTFAPEEDEGQVAAFLQRHPEFMLADVLGNVDYPFGSEGEANRTGGLPLDVSKVRRIWPCQGGEGHFMARLVKAGTPRTLPAPGEYTPEEQLWLAAAAEAGKKAKGSKPQKAAKPADARSARRENSRACREAVQGRSSRSRDAGAGDASPAQSLAAWREFAEEYFPGLAKRPAVVHGGGVLLPAAFPQTNLHVLRAGVFVGSVQKGRFVPEHHLFTAFGAFCQNREKLTLADSRTVEYLSGREIEAHTAADGWCCVTVDGWPLGGGKVSGGRVKNHYPKALRLL